MKFLIYDKTGKILRQGHCRNEQDAIPLANMLKEEYLLVHEGGNIDIKKYIIKDFMIVERPIEDIYKERALTGLRVNQIKINNIDAELIAYFGPNYDIEKWKQDNYIALRKMKYPPIEDYVDAQVKIASGDVILETEGRKQLDAYVTKCLAVKQQFNASAKD